MKLGQKIKDYRVKAGLTQKDLADKLNVTYQAVSRWENGDAEPSFDTVKEMLTIFNCSADEFMDNQSGEPSETVEPVKPEVVERIVEVAAPIVLGVCEKCNNPIFKPEDIHRFTTRSRSGRHTHAHDHLYCSKCYEEKKKQEQALYEARKAEEKEKRKKRLIHSFIWPSLVAAIAVILTVTSFNQGNTEAGIFWAIGIYAFYAFTACMILRNNCVFDVWLEVASWGFVKLPGIIFEFSLDGFIFLILIKILFWILGFVLAIVVGILATLIASVVGMFVYPFALAGNIKGTEHYDPII